MPRFRKKPVEVQAWHWNGTEKNARMLMKLSPNIFYCEGPGTLREMEIETLEGRMTVSPGDWIIKGVKGEFYPCKPDIFNATYDPV
jgi:hypothetical protein